MYRKEFEQFEHQYTYNYVQMCWFQGFWFYQIFPTFPQKDFRNKAEFLEHLESKIYTTFYDRFGFKFIYYFLNYLKL